MILVNQSAHDYRYFMEVTSTKTITGSLPADMFISAVMTGTWGNPYADSAISGTENHGWLISYINQLHHTVYSHSGYLRIPHLNLTVTFSGSGWLSPFDCELYFTNLALTTDCNSWTVDWDAIEFFVLGASIYSNGTHRTLSGTDFNPDDNKLKARGTPAPDLVGAPMVGCLSCPIPPFPDYEELRVQLSGTIIFGWEHKPSTTWIRETIDLVTTFEPPDQECDCTLGLDVPTEESPPTCRYVHVPFSADSHSWRTFYANLNCYCDGVLTFTFPVYKYENEYVIKEAEACADPIIQTNRKTLEESGSACWDSGGTPPFDTTTQITDRDHALARWWAHVVHVYGNKYCSLATDSPPICAPGIHEWELGIFICDDIPDCHTCAYEAYSGLSWLDTICGSGNKNVSYDTSLWQRHYIAYIDESNHIHIKRASHVLPLLFDDLDTGIDATGVCVRIDRYSKAQALYLLNSNSGNIYWRHSKDEGETWTMAETISTGKSPAFIISKSTLRYIYWIDSNGGGGYNVFGQVRDEQNNIIVATFTAVTGVDTDGGLAVDESFGTQGDKTILLTYTVSGTLTTKTSKDGKTFS